jgi:hypothetical protein
LQTFALPLGDRALTLEGFFMIAPNRDGNSSIFSDRVPELLAHPRAKNRRVVRSFPIE